MNAQMLISGAVLFDSVGGSVKKDVCWTSVRKHFSHPLRQLQVQLYTWFKVKHKMRRERLHDIRWPLKSELAVDNEYSFISWCCRLQRIAEAPMRLRRVPRWEIKRNWLSKYSPLCYAHEEYKNIANKNRSGHIIEMQTLKKSNSLDAILYNPQKQNCSLEKRLDRTHRQNKNSCWFVRSLLLKGVLNQYIIWIYYHCEAIVLESFDDWCKRDPWKHFVSFPTLFVWTVLYFSFPQSRGFSKIKGTLKLFLKKVVFDLILFKMKRVW